MMNLDPVSPFLKELKNGYQRAGLGNVAAGN